MAATKYLAAFNAQKATAKQRGIAWELTFDQWLSWWGEDIDKRGKGKGLLQMQRLCDSGSYALGNIRKGTQAQNSATFSRCEANRRSSRARIEHEQFLDALMWAKSKEARDAHGEDLSFEIRANGRVNC